MVEVEGEERNTGITEERMVGVDLSKGVILEIQITTGKTFAKHNLGKNKMALMFSLMQVLLEAVCFTRLLQLVLSLSFPRRHQQRGYFESAGRLLC